VENSNRRGEKRENATIVTLNSSGKNEKKGTKYCWPRSKGAKEAKSKNDNGE
jgi:hypothetical protein